MRCRVKKVTRVDKGRPRRSGDLMDLGNAEKHVREPTEAARRVALPQGGAAPSRTPSQPGNAQVKALYKN